MAKVVINDMMDKAFIVTTYNEHGMNISRNNKTLEIVIKEETSGAIVDLAHYDWLGDIKDNIQSIALYNNELDRVLSETESYRYLSSISKYVLDETEDKIYNRTVITFVDVKESV